MNSLYQSIFTSLASQKRTFTSPGTWPHPIWDLYQVCRYFPYFTILLPYFTLSVCRYFPYFTILLPYFTLSVCRYFPYFTILLPYFTLSVCRYFPYFTILLPYFTLSVCRYFPYFTILLPYFTLSASYNTFSAILYFILQFSVIPNVSKQARNELRTCT